MREGPRYWSGVNKDRFDSKISNVRDNHLDIEIHQWIYPRIAYKVYAHLKYLAGNNKNLREQA